MKLFENKVGRPSNEVKKNRRIFVVSMITLGAVLLTLGVSFLVNINSDRLKGAASEKPANTSFDDMNFYKCVIDNYNKEKGTKLSYKTKLTDNQLNGISKLACSNRGITSVKGIEKITNLRSFDGDLNRISKINVSKNIKLEYLNLYDTKLEYIDLNKNINLKSLSIGAEQLKSIDLTNNKKLESLGLNSVSLKNLDLSKNVNLVRFGLYYMNLSDLNLDSNKNLKELSIVSDNNLRTLNLVQNTSLNQLVLFMDDNLENVYLDESLDRKMIRVDRVESNDNNVINIADSPKVKIVPIKDKLELECPATAFVGEKITCKTNSTKSTIRVSKGGLSDHYLELLNKSSGRFTTPKKVVYLMYTKKGYAKVVAEQNGSNSVTRIIEIKEPLKLSCPSSVKVGKQFTCITNMVGAKISVTKGGLSNGYNTSFTTVKGDLTKQSKYTKTGTVTVTVSKSGYKSVSKTVKIVK